VKASLVFLQRFTEADEAEWEAAWEKAHSEHDADFNGQRDTLCVRLGRRYITDESAVVEAILANLDKLGVERTIPAWTAGQSLTIHVELGLRRSANQNGMVRPPTRRWQHRLKKDYTAAFDEEMQTRLDVIWGELKAGLRAIDEAHNASLWSSVRETFNYPVFVAAPKTVGITSTGETGETVPNELPELLKAFRCVRSMAKSGMPTPRTRRFFSCPPLPDPPVEGSEPWIVTEAVSHQHSHFPLTPLREMLTQRREILTLGDSFEDWTPITVHLTGDISARNRTESYKGSNFAAYPGDIVFSKIDARSGAIGVLPPEIDRAVVTA
jgi:hypothetical protein